MSPSEGNVLIKIFEKIDNVLISFFKVIIVILFIGMIVLILAQVYTRFFTTHSLTWSEELSRYALVYLVFLSAIILARQKGHLSIENLVNILPVPVARVVRVISILLQILFFVFVIWGAFRLFPIASMRVSPANSIPMTIIYFCVPLFCSLGILYAIRDLVRIFYGKGGDR